MYKFNELIAIVLVLLAIGGPVCASLCYEASLANKRNAIELEARAVSTWSKKEIRVKKGELVRIRVSNKDNITHGFAIPELDIEERIIHPGQNEIVEFRPEWEGEYVYRCIVLCDRNEDMTGKLIVEK